MLDSAPIQSLFAALAGVAGIGSIAAGVLFGRRAASSTSWLPVSAKILSSRVVPDDGGYTARVCYRYSIDGQDYESSTIRILTSSSSSKSAALAVTSRYPTSSQVIAYVDPAEHRRAVLEPGRHHFAVFLFIGTGLALLAMGVHRYLSVLGVLD